MMSGKKRDNKNRILRSGESQRKDGRYAYKYTDTFGKVQFVYAWKLVPTDKNFYKLPPGKSATFRVVFVVWIRRNNNKIFN